MENRQASGPPGLELYIPGLDTLAKRFHDPSRTLQAVLMRHVFLPTSSAPGLTEFCPILAAQV